MVSCTDINYMRARSIDHSRFLRHGGGVHMPAGGRIRRARICNSRQNCIINSAWPAIFTCICMYVWLLRCSLQRREDDSDISVIHAARNSRPTRPSIDAAVCRGPCARVKIRVVSVAAVRNAICPTVCDARAEVRVQDVAGRAWK